MEDSEMQSPTHKPSHDDAAPFLLKLYCRNGSFYRPEDFASYSPPHHISIWTWPSCTLHDLTLELAAAKPSALPTPAIGTRLVFQLVFPDLRSTSTIPNSQPRYAVKDLGSLVIGEGGPGAEEFDDVEGGGRLRVSDKDKTLSESKFVVGDYVSCAILPPLPDGSVASTSSVKMDSAPPRDSRGGFRGGRSGRENGFGRGGGRGGRGGWRDDIGGGFPMGDWRRGDRLPDGASSRPRGRGQW